MNTTQTETMKLQAGGKFLSKTIHLVTTSRHGIVLFCTGRTMDGFLHEETTEVTCKACLKRQGKA